MRGDHQPIQLAEEPAFRLGALAVTPATRQVAWAGQTRTLEPRVMEVLVALAGAGGGVVGRDALIARCWGGRVVGDNAINRVISILRRLESDSGAFVLETVTKVGYRLAIRDAPAGKDARATVRARQRGWRPASVAAVALLGVALLALPARRVAWPLGPQALPPGQNGRIELAGFEPRRSDAEVQGLATATGEALVRALTRGGLEVLSAGAAAGGAGADAAPELRIRGSVDREDETLVIATEVSERRSGLVLSASRFVRPAAAAAGFADQVSVGLAAGLDCALEDRKQSRKPMSAKVLGLYLNTCDAIAREGNMPRMLGDARRLVAAAPKLAIAQALYAIAQANSANPSALPSAEVEALRRGARQSAAEALRLDPRTPKAFIAIANSYGEGSHWREREEALLQVHRLDPNMNPGRFSYVNVLIEVGRLRAAADILDQIMASDDPRTLSGAEGPAAVLYGMMGELRTARDFLARLERTDPEGARVVAWRLASTWEEPEPALVRLQGIVRHPNFNMHTYGCVTQYLRELSQRQASHARGLPPACDGVPADRRVQMLAREGDVDGAYAEAPIALSAAGTTPAFLFYDTMKPFRRDPRFWPLAKRLNLVDYWVKSGSWPDFCAEPGLPYDCRAKAREIAAPASSAASAPARLAAR